MEKSLNGFNLPSVFDPAVDALVDNFRMMDGLLGGAEATSITYDELKALKDSGSLNVGQRYRIIDFRTVYRKPDGINPVWMTDGRATDPSPSTVEPLIVTAVTNNSFGPLAVSELYPEDIIYFSFDEDVGVSLFDANNTRGFIYRRINKFGVDMPYDFRNCRWRRLEVDYAAIPVWDSSTEYQIGAKVRNSGTPDSIIYAVTKQIVPAGKTSPQNNPEYWCPLINLKKTMYVATSKNNATGKWVISGSPISLPLTGNYRDLLTFSTPDGEPDLRVDSKYLRNNYIRGGSNNVFYGSGTQTTTNNVIGYECSRNTICTGFNNNTIGNGFFENTIYSAFSNLIGNDFSGNSSVGTFAQNTIGYLCKNNAFGGVFQEVVVYNKCSENYFSDVYSGSLGEGFSGNVVGKFFTGNTIGTGFSNGRLGGFFSNNSIGNGVRGLKTAANFQNNIIHTGCSFGSDQSLSGVTELHGKSYPHIIQKCSDGSIAINWLSGEGLQTILI